MAVIREKIQDLVEEVERFAAQIQESWRRSIVDRRRS